MARRSSSPVPERPVLTADQLRRRIERIRNCIQQLESFQPEKVQSRYNIPEVMQIEAAIDQALEAAFGHNTPAFLRYSDATVLDRGPHEARSDPMFGGYSESYYDARDAQEARRYLAEGKQRSTALLHQAINTLEDEIADIEPNTATESRVTVATKRDLKKIFIVHGHEEGPREAVRSFLMRLDFVPIVLHDQPNKGRTIITKFREEAGDVGFAIVLMTPDDVGKAKAAADLRPRARQNVVFELGFFIGELGPERVAALVQGGVERPSDFDGVVYIDLDDSGAWKMVLARELRAAGLSFDGNRVFE